MTTYDFIASNKRKTVLLLLGFTFFVGLIGYVIDRNYNTGGGFLVIALVYALGSALVGYYAGDRIVLATSGAQPIDREDDLYLSRMGENLCLSTGMLQPKVYIIPDSAINAFATGRDPAHASIAVTSGAIEKLQNEELEGVLAHELSHIRNYDIRVMTLVIVLVGLISVIVDMAFRFSMFGGGRRRGNDREGGFSILMVFGLIAVILSPIIAKLIQLAISRRREYLADASAALTTRFPQGLANALRKIELESQPMQNASSATAHLFFASPFSGKGVREFFSTHPPIEKRIAALETMSAPNA